MKNIERYAEGICRTIVGCSTCYFDSDCKACGLANLCCDEEKLLAFMLQPVADEDEQLLHEPQGTV